MRDRDLAYPWNLPSKNKAMEESKDDHRKLRLMMKGLKVGAVKGGQRVNIQSIMNKMK